MKEYLSVNVCYIWSRLLSFRFEFCLHKFLSFEGLFHQIQYASTHLCPWLSFSSQLDVLSLVSPSLVLKYPLVLSLPSLVCVVPAYVYLKKMLEYSGCEIVDEGEIVPTFFGLCLQKLDRNTKERCPSNPVHGLGPTALHLKELSNFCTKDKQAPDIEELRGSLTGKIRGSKETAYLR